jgi:hypothetical protein
MEGAVEPDYAVEPDFSNNDDIYVHLQSPAITEAFVPPYDDVYPPPPTMGSSYNFPELQLESPYDFGASSTDALYTFANDLTQPDFGSQGSGDLHFDGVSGGASDLGWGAQSSNWGGTFTQQTLPVAAAPYIFPANLAMTPLEQDTSSRHAALMDRAKGPSLFTTPQPERPLPRLRTISSPARPAFARDPSIAWINSEAPAHRW